jgi:hypothetical protein
VRYDYKCDDCGNVVEVSHAMGEARNIVCRCGCKMRIMIASSPPLVTGMRGRSVLRPDTPSNKEYQAYKKWEDAGGAPDAPERKDFLAARGDI